jgi:L-aminopeptidase/D-esterase-like protein
MELNNEFGEQGARSIQTPDPADLSVPSNTTLAVVATDATLTKVQAHKLAQMAHDGMARAIRPSHTMFDGDTIFCLSTGKRDLPQAEGFFAAPYAQAINELGAAAADCLTRAIIHATLHAETLGLYRAFRDLKDR